MTSTHNISRLGKGQLQDVRYDDICFERGTLMRRFGRWSTLDGCVFEKCSFEARSILKRVKFIDCIFRGCTFGSGREPIYTSSAIFDGCNFADCNFSIWEDGKGGSAAFRRCDVDGGSFLYFNYRKADFSDTIIRSKLTDFSLSECFGTCLDISRSEVEDAIIFNASNFEKILLSEDLDRRFWRTWKQIFSLRVFETLKGDFRDLDEMKEKLRKTSKQNDVTLTFVNDNLEDFFDLKTSAGLDDAFDLLKSFSPEDQT